MKKCVLHIGRHKCGSSALQKFLSENQEELSEMGWHYPIHARPEQTLEPIAHHLVAIYYNKNLKSSYSPTDFANLRTEVDLFWKEVDSVENIIVSSEGFQNLNPHDISKPFSGYEIEIVCYFRELVSYFLSSYAQVIQANRFTYSLEEFLEKRFYVDYLKFINDWRSAFPDADFTFRLFDRSLLIDGDIRSDFLNSSSFVSRSLDRSKLRLGEIDQNPSIGGKLLEFKTALNEQDCSELIASKDLYRLLNEVARKNPSFARNQYIPPKLYKALDQKMGDKARGAERLLGFDQGALFQPYEEMAKNYFRDISGQIEDLAPGVGVSLLNLIAGGEV